MARSIPEGARGTTERGSWVPRRKVLATNQGKLVSMTDSDWEYECALMGAELEEEALADELRQQDPRRALCQTDWSIPKCTAHLEVPF